MSQFSPLLREKVPWQNMLGVQLKRSTSGNVQDILMPTFMRLTKTKLFKHTSPGLLGHAVGIQSLLVAHFQGYLELFNIKSD